MAFQGSSKFGIQNILKDWVTLVAFIWAGLGVYFNIQALLEGRWQSIGVFFYYFMLAVLFLIRKPSLDEVHGFKHRIIALAGSWLPLLTMPSQFNHPVVMAISIPLQTVGFIYLMLAIASLWRSFGIFAAYREIRMGGLYRFVRHPLYSAELVGYSSVILQNLSAYNVCLFLIQIICQLIRIRDEEALLSQDPVYQEYCKRVRYRLIPWVY